MIGTVTIQVSLAQESFEQFARLAEEREQSAAELLEQLAIEFLEKEQAQEADFRALAQAGTKFPGEYVAIHHGQIIAHHSRADTLLQIVQEQFGLTSMDVVLYKSDDSSELRVRHPRLVE